MSAPFCLWSLVRQRQCIFLGFNPFRDQLQVVNPNIRLKWFWLSGIRPGAAGVSQSHTLLGFNPFMFDLLSRKCHAETQKARLMQDTELYFRSVSSRKGEVKILQQNCIWKGFRSFLQSFVQITRELAMPSLHRHNMITVHASSIKPGLATNYPGKPIPFQRPTKCFATMNSGSRFRNARNKFSGSTVTFHSTQVAFERSAATNCTHQLHDS